MRCAVCDLRPAACGARAPAAGGAASSSSLQPGLEVEALVQRALLARVGLALGELRRTSNGSGTSRLTVRSSRAFGSQSSDLAQVLADARR